MRNRVVSILVILVLVLLAGWAFLQTRQGVTSLLVYQDEPVGIMGTNCNLVVVSDRDQADEAGAILASAESELRRLEALLSTWIEASPISRFNESSADQPIEFPPELAEVLSASRVLHRDTQGVFDITARPLIELWRLAAETGIPPSPEHLHAARAESNWDHIRLAGRTASKLLTTTRVDIDGIAKGYAIDRALAILQGSEARGGLVEVGGDLRVFGESPESDFWTVAIRSPFQDRPWAEIELQEGAVCTSGDYARFIEISGQRFSHIIDPRTGLPTDETHAVTVVGPDAASADAWATALSVLGPAGLELLEDNDLEALIVTGEPEDYRLHITPGFRHLLVRAAFDLP